MHVPPDEIANARLSFMCMRERPLGLLKDRAGPSLDYSIRDELGFGCREAEARPRPEYNNYVSKKSVARIQTQET